MQLLYSYYFILIATSVKSQISVITSNNGTSEEIGVALGPASVSLKLSGNADSEDTISPRQISSIINSNELATNEISPNTPENEILADENEEVPVEEEDFTVTGNSTSAIADSGYTPIVLSSNATESGTTNTPSILANSSPITISSNLSTQPTTTVPIVITPIIGDISGVSTTTVPIQITTMGAISGVSTTIVPIVITTMESGMISGVSTVPNSTVTSSVRTESGSIMTAPTSQTTEPSSLKLNTEASEATPISVQSPSPNYSYITSSPTASIASSASTIPPISPAPTVAHSGTTLSPNICGENEVYSCLPLCPRTCNNPLSKVLCPPIPSYISFCRRGCTCMTGYLFEKSIQKCLKKCPATLPLNG